MMRVLIRSGIGLGWLALVVTGCSSGPAAPSAQSIETSGFGQTVGGIQVVVDPLFGRERASAEFPGGETFEEQGLLPVQVLIENGSRQPVRADRADFRLVRPQNRADVALSPLDAFGMVKPPVGWWAALPILGPSASAYRNSDWLKQFEARALKDIPVAPGGSAVGLVYFYFPENEKSLAGTRIVLVVRGDTGEERTFDIPLQGRRGILDAPAPTAPAAAPGQRTQPSSTPTRVDGAGGGVIIRSPAP
jgi:hypothetical protein